MQKDKKGTLSHQKIKCSFLDYAQLLMIGRSGQWTRSPSATPLQPKKIKCSFMDYLQLLMTGQAGGWTQILSATPLQPKRWNAHFWIMFNFWWSAGLVNGLETPSTTPLQPKNEMLIFGLHLTSYDLPGWSKESNPVHHASPTKKMKCSF